MKSVCKLDQHNADIICHREEHFAKILGLLFLVVAECNFSDFGDAVDKMRGLPGTPVGRRDGPGRAADLTSTLLTAWALAGAGDGKKALETADKLRGERSYNIFRDYHAGLIAALVGNTAEAEKRLKAAYDRAAKHADFREMLARERDLDAVVVATPDHTHAVIAAAAMRAGKHVYVQKPLTYSVHEARTLARLANETKVVTQMGNQGASKKANNPLPVRN